jgi:hypothetical protein
MKCRLCGKGPLEIGGYLQRVNEKGMPGIWECRPSCGANLKTPVIDAINGTYNRPAAPEKPNG